MDTEKDTATKNDKHLSVMYISKRSASEIVLDIIKACH